MASGLDVSIEEYCAKTADAAKAASFALAKLRGETKNAWLNQAADALHERASELQAANAEDLAKAPEFGLTSAAVDRLRLTDRVIASMAAGLRQVAQLPNPVGEVMSSNIRPNGLEVQKVRAPLGVVFFIYESRPNVTADAAALCVKSGNAVILRGGKEAIHSNRAIAAVLSGAARETGVPADAVQLVQTTDREAVGRFLKMSDRIDLTIPRGGEGLIRRVVDEATMPVMKHFAGNCHVYVDASADPALARKLVVNSKCQRYGVCNAAESLVVHGGCGPKLLEDLIGDLIAAGVEVRGDVRACDANPEVLAAEEADFAAEFLGPTISVRVVDSLDEAIEHINRFSSGHTEAIVTRDLEAARAFAASIDSSAVMINASTRFNDGFEFGLGAEIGISTDKFHARGPCGLNELTTYKYVVYGSGQIRE